MILHDNEPNVLCNTNWKEGVIYINCLVVSACLAVRVTIFSTGGKFDWFQILRSCTFLLKLPILMCSWCMHSAQSNEFKIDAWMNARVCDDIIFITDDIIFITDDIIFIAEVIMRS